MDAQDAARTGNNQEENMETQISRRSFLTGLGAAGIAVAGAGLAGCAP
ncbi:twin-arginine translocation signal domain-containing protein, partial [Eggerthella sinensis]